jgi:8-oxo-dGTP pyrophosphatase MutT (NUDIX family)
MPHIHEEFDFTASAFVLHPTEEKILLLKHRKIGKWLQPGGHVELDENPWQALEHELHEETGLYLKNCTILMQPEQPTARGNTVLPLPFHFNQHNFNDTHKHIDLCYLLRADTDKLTTNPDGADEIAWLSRQEIHKLHAEQVLFDATYDICEWIFNRFNSLTKNSLTTAVKETP